MANSPSGKRRPHWTAALLPQIAETMRPFIEDILRQGVDSKDDLRTRLERMLKGRISGRELNDWLRHLGYDSVFVNRPRFQLPPHPVTPAVERPPLEPPPPVDETEREVDEKLSTKPLDVSSGDVNMTVTPPRGPMGPAKNVKKGEQRFTVIPPFGG